MKLLLIAVVFIGTVSAYTYDKDLECSMRGPKFWCQSIKTAKQCQATSYCAEHVWSKNFMISDDICTECQQYVGIIHMLLADNATQQEVLDSLKTACSLLPTSVQPMCTNAVDQYGQEIMNLIVQYTVDAKQFCNLIGLCNSTSHRVKVNVPLMTKLIKQKIKDDYCLTCQQYVGTVHMLIANNSTKAEIVSGLKSACSLLPSIISGECNVIVELYGSKLVDMLVSYTADPSKFCAAIGLCKGRTNIPLVVQQKMMANVVRFNRRPEFKNTKLVQKLHIQNVKNPVTCEVCKNALQYLDSLLQENSTKQEVKMVLNKLCGYLPGHLQSECIDLVSQYSDQIINLIVGEFANPVQICKALGLCTGSKKVAPLKKVKSPVTCEVCEYAMQYLDSLLQENSTEQEVKAALDSLCGYLPSSYQTECTSLVNTYADQIIKLIVGELANPAEICKELGLCTSSKVKKVAPLKKVKSPVTCEVCEYAMQYLDSLLQENSTEQEVKAALDSLCGYLPSSYQTECTSLVDTYTDQIIKLIVVELANPAEICKELGLCTPSKTKKATIRSKATLPKSAVTCKVCEVAAQYLDGLLEDKTSERAVKAALDSMCGYLPSSYSAECKVLVDSYSDTIVKLIVHELATPATLCKELKLCSSTKKAVSVEKVKSPVTCEICQYAMQYLDGILEQNSTEQEVKAALNSLCGYLPPSVKEECTSLVNQYSDAIIKFIVQELKNPKDICTELELCNSAKRKLLQKKERYSEGGEVSCTLCQYAMGKLDSVLAKNSTQEEIKHAVETLCTRLPTYMSSECKLLLEEYGDAIITVLVQELNPSIVCKTLGLCSSSRKTSKKYMLAMRMSFGGVSCSICQYAMSYLDTLLENKTTKEEIEQAVMSLCNYLPSAIENECNALIKEYGDELIDLIVQQIKPDVICKELKLC